MYYRCNSSLQNPLIQLNQAEIMVLHKRARQTFPSTSFWCRICNVVIIYYITFTAPEEVCHERTATAVKPPHRNGCGGPFGAGRVWYPGRGEPRRHGVDERGPGHHRGH